MSVENKSHVFNYAQSYVKNAKAITFSPQELPLVTGKKFYPKNELHAVFADALPDAWGRRVLHYRYQTAALSEIELLLRFGLERNQAQAMIDEMVETIQQHWFDTCALAQLTKLQAQQFWKTAVLNPYVLYDKPF